MYLEGFVSLDHVVEGVDCEVVVDDFFLALVLLVRELQVDVDDLLYLPARLLDLEVLLVDLVHHLRVEQVVVAPLERVLLQYRLRVLPNRLLDVLTLTKSTPTRMRMSWSRYSRKSLL